MAAVEQKVKQIIVEQLGVDESQVDNNASFVDDLGADSLEGRVVADVARGEIDAEEYDARAQVLRGNAPDRTSHTAR